MGAERERSADVLVHNGLEDLVDRARHGDRSALPALRHHLETHPEVWEQCGNLALQAQEAWVQLLAGPDLLLSESVRRKMEVIRAELSGPIPNQLETLLIDRILACWVQAYYADMMYTQARGPDSTPAIRQELMKRQESSQRRYLASIRQLVVVRKLQVQWRVDSGSRPIPVEHSPFPRLAEG